MGGEIAQKAGKEPGTEKKRWKNQKNRTNKGRLQLPRIKPFCERGKKKEKSINPVDAKKTSKQKRKGPANQGREKQGLVGSPTKRFARTRKKNLN